MYKNSSSTPVSPEERCEQMVQDLEAWFGVTLTFQDLTGALRTPTGIGIIRSRLRHWHPYCQVGRSDGNPFDKRCLQHCLTEVGQRFAEDKRPFLSHCWKGNREVVVPIYRVHQHVLTIFAGGFRRKTDKIPEAVRHAQPNAEEHFQSLRLLDEEETSKLMRLLHTLGLGLLKEVEDYFDFEDNRNDRGANIRRFIHYNAHRDIRIQDLADILYLSTSRTGHVVVETCGKPFNDLVLDERIAKAKYLLTHTRHAQELIAHQCGFKSPFYFNRCFSKQVGTPPGKYRREKSSPATT